MQGGGLQLCSHCLSPERHTFPVHFMVRVVQVVPLIRSIEVVHVNVEIIRCLPEVILTLV